MTPLEALHLIQSAIGVAVFFQTIEMFQIRSAWADDGVWGWNNLKGEFPNFFSAFYREKNFFSLLSAQLAASILLLISRDFSLALVVLVVCLLICWRWRGTFNGGSDSVTIQVLLVLTLVGFFPDSKTLLSFAIVYLALQLVLSYFIAGIAKLKKPSWRNGEALTQLLTKSHYITPIHAHKLVQSKTRARFFSWVILFFECSFPISLLHSRVAIFYLTAGVFFHLMNYWVFGLNRFVFSWLALYPALYAVTIYFGF